jgi:hypothetical protein
VAAALLPLLDALLNLKAELVVESEGDAVLG